MFLVNWVKVTLKTEKGVFGYQGDFKHGLNLVSSCDNTCGKSSVIAAIYYCLGLEEILGGQGGKVLPSAYKTSIEYNGEEIKVYESSAYLEINNGVRTITLFRTIKSSHRDDSLITVYNSNMDDIYKAKTTHEDYYVHSKHSATNEKGFYTFLESFLHLQLPVVPAVDGSNRKLYLQIVFSAMFIEQKQGWSSIFARIPYLGIRESKRRVVEFLLQLDIINNERTKEKCKSDEARIRNEWKNAVQKIIYSAQVTGMTMHNIPLSPQLFTKDELMAITAIDSINHRPIEEVISDLHNAQQRLYERTPIVKENYNDLQAELIKVDNDIRELSNQLSEMEVSITAKRSSIGKLEQTLEILKSDLRNNQDAAKLKRLGSDIDGSMFSDICPVCHQHVDDSLLVAKNYVSVMGIDENIAHLQAQIQMLEFSILGRKKEVSDCEQQVEALVEQLHSLQRLGKSIRSDLFAVNGEVSETLIRKRIENENRISALQNLVYLIDSYKEEISLLSKEWEQMLILRNSLPKKAYSEKDEEKLDKLCKSYINNLKEFGYKSITNINTITLSQENYMPMVENFDMKFDSSASDNIRVIWAYTLALLQTSLKYGGNHPGIIIFDEPDQHSIVISDLEKLFKTIINIKNECQVIIGITEKDSDTQSIINSLTEEQCHKNAIIDKAFMPVVAPIKDALQQGEDSISEDSNSKEDEAKKS